LEVTEGEAALAELPGRMRQPPPAAEEAGQVGMAAAAPGEAGAAVKVDLQPAPRKKSPKEGAEVRLLGPEVRRCDLLSEIHAKKHDGVTLRCRYAEEVKAQVPEIIRQNVAWGEERPSTSLVMA
jgi:hypothetical protein